MYYHLEDLPTQYCFATKLRFCGVSHHQVFPNTVLEWRALKECRKAITQGLEGAIENAVKKRELIRDGWGREQKRHEVKTRSNSHLITTREFYNEAQSFSKSIFSAKNSNFLLNTRGGRSPPAECLHIPPSFSDPEKWLGGLGWHIFFGTTYLRAELVSNMGFKLVTEIDYIKGTEFVSR